MSVPSQNPVRLADARLACGGEFILRPEDGLHWLPHLAGSLCDFAATELRGEAAVTLVLTAAPSGEPCTGLILRLRAEDPYSSAQECLAAREGLLSKARELLADGPEYHEPLSAEGLFVRLPRADMRFLRRPKAADGQPVIGQELLRMDMKAAQELMQRHPDSGMALTLLRCPPEQLIAEAPRMQEAAAQSEAWRTIAEERRPLAFTLCLWGSAAPLWASLLNSAGLDVRLYEAAEFASHDPVVACESQFDPWALNKRVCDRLNAHGLNSVCLRTSVEELSRLLGTQHAPAPVAAADVAPTEIAASVQQAVQGLLGSIPSLTAQMLESAGQLREGMQKQITGHMAGRLSTVQQSLQALSGKLAGLPGVQQSQVDSLLRRLQENLPLPEIVDAARQAGLDQPLDTVSLMKMGFSSEEEMLSAGLPADTLSLLRSAFVIHSLQPAHVGTDDNCMPYAIMLGYLYEALASSCFHQLFVRAKVKRGNGLSSYDVVDWKKCEAFADCQAFCSAELNALTPGDWAVWLNLMACCRLLRNRQHSDKGHFGFISRAESDAFFEMMFFPGQSGKLTMLQLPCNGACPPEWSKRFEPKIPAEWTDAPAADPCACLQEHVRRSAAAFRPSLLRLMISCARLLPGEEKA